MCCGGAHHYLTAHAIGAIYFVVPNVAGVCVHAPPLDDIGNSARAVEFCKRLKRRLPMAVMDICFQT